MPLVYVTEDSHERVASPQSDYTLTQSEASEEFIPPKPSGKFHQAHFRQSIISFLVALEFLSGFF